MRRRFVLPSDLASLVADERVGRCEAVTVRFRGDETLLVVTEERSDRVDLVAAGETEVSDRIGFALADAMAGELPVRWRGHAYRLMIEEADGRAWPAEALVPDGEGAALLDVSVDGDGSAFRPPAWMDRFREVKGAASFQALFGAPEPPAGKWLVDVVRPLLEGRRQTRLAMQAMAERAVTMEPPSPWEAIRSHARDLGMELSADKADVRTALAPLAAGGDAVGFLSGLDAREGAILVQDGLFVLCLGEGGPLLGQAPWTRSTGFTEGTAIVGPGTRYPTVFHGDVALALAKEGYHRSQDGAEIGLWSLDRLGEIRAVLCGLHPSALLSHARRDDP